MSTEAKKCFVMGFIGRSGSGKTTLAAAVLRILAARGWRVCAVKDAHHHIDLDTPGKDTWRYRESGASRVILRTPERWAVLTETPEGAPGIDELLKETGDADIVLVEGFKHEGSFPKIEVRRQAAADRPPPVRGFGGRAKAGELGGRINLAAAASDFDEPDFAGVPKLDINRPEETADFIERLALAAGAKKSAR